MLEYIQGSLDDLIQTPGFKSHLYVDNIQLSVLPELQAYIIPLPIPHLYSDV